MVDRLYSDIIFGNMALIHTNWIFEYRQSFNALCLLIYAKEYEIKFNWSSSYVNYSFFNHSYIFEKKEKEIIYMKLRMICCFIKTVNIEKRNKYTLTSIWALQESRTSVL